MKNYSQMKQEHEEKINAFPMVFAFSQTQFEEAMQKLGLTTEDTDKIYRIPGGGFIRKTDSDKMKTLFAEMTEEQDKLMKDDDFMIGALNYELWNHEYGYTGNPEPAFEALGLDINELKNKDSRIYKNFMTAKKGIN